ncbi:pectinesterase family protein [Nafulsella turpanensis]|uniref:pectinesterase family protein n=1 Tax=Nafulsella turpanensis TaxID=1265690 RepID=UPI00034B336E|nr:pectinesterase family protein [Nafulsella turpanensis]
MKVKFYLSYLSFAFLLLCTSVVHGQTTGSRTYDFRDGTIVNNGQSEDGSLSLSGTYGHHGSTYGLNMKVDGEINLTVDGSNTIRFLGSQHSGLNMLGTATTEGDLGTQNTKVANDLSDTYDFVYSGNGQPLNFKLTAGAGNDLYLPTIEVIPAQSGAAATVAEKNIIYYYDFRDGSIVPTNTTGQEDINLGLIGITPGSSNAYGYNGEQHGSVFKTGNQISLQVDGNSYIKVGGSIYSSGTISVSSASGDFDVSSQSSTTSGNFGNDGSTVDFLYIGTAGTVTLDFTGTNYVPYIEVAPVPYEVSLTPWIQKAGTITLNGTDIGVTSGADANSDATITLSSGTVISATNEEASILMDLGGNALSTFTPAFTGDIAAVNANGDMLEITFVDEASNPTSYVIKVADNSLTAEAEPGKTYIYNFADGSEMPQTSYNSLRYKTFVTKDGLVTINSNTDTESLQFGYHDSSHGGVFFPGNSFDIAVAGNATITFLVDTYGNATDAVFEFTDAQGNVLGTAPATNIGGADGFPSNFSYEGPKGVITATLRSENFPTAEIYLHGLSVANEATIEASNGKTDVWDFGAVQLDETLYNNQLTEEIINSWYDPSITVGSSGNVLPSFSAGVLSWIGGGNDRLRTTNTNLTRYDENISDAEGYTGRIYVNSAGATGRYLSLTLSEDDEVTIVTKTDAGGTIHFEYVADPAAQTDVVEITSELTELNFVAKEAGTYRIYDTQGKPSYYRIYRKDADYAAVSGAVDVSQAADIPADYQIVFTNEAGKSWAVPVTNGVYTASLPVGYTYELSLANAEAYIISNGTTLEVTGEAVTHDIAIKKVELYNVSGAIAGLAGQDLSSLELVFTPDPAANKSYMPSPVVDATNATYTVKLEPGTEYTISAEGVNDYYIPANTITIGQADETADITFAPKPLYKVTIDAADLTAEQLAKLALTFTNMADEYTYTFTSVDDIALRDGTYTISYDGLDEYPLTMGLTSNLTIDGEAATKVLSFEPVRNWSFDDEEITNDTQAYKGLLFSGNIANEMSKGHLTAKAGATIQVPVEVGDKITVSYYYSADFSIEGGEAVTTESNSTSNVETVDYVYPGTEAGYVTITIGEGASTTYITDIAISEALPYTPTLYVGADKEYKTINAALDAIATMDREDDQRVTVMIDPGNYEEMLVITEPSVTLKNAAASPSIDLLNKGVDIAENAVRITSYYGHGYNYYSMGSDQKWDADVLRVNKENGYLSYENKGSGTTNGSYWNATVVVSADNFVAEDIIFENSFNQYISKKESEDIVVMWEAGSKGERPTTVGSTEVQDRSFVERAAALAITNNTDKVILDNVRVVGRQDSFFGGSNARVAVYKGVMMGAVDYIFGGMTAVFYQTGLVMNVSDASNDASYLTAAQQREGRGYLMYETTVRSAIPGVETASTYLAKPGYFGRPWEATTSEVVFYNTTVETSDYPGSEGESLIMPLGWQNTLGGESSMMYEYGTIEESGVDNSDKRASWSTVLAEPVLSDGTEITPFNFTKGNDGWDPIATLIAEEEKPDEEVTGINDGIGASGLQVYPNPSRQKAVTISYEVTKTGVVTLQVINLQGKVVKQLTHETLKAGTHQIQFKTGGLHSGMYIIQLKTGSGMSNTKLYLR